jgi:hypothetical protein
MLYFYLYLREFILRISLLPLNIDPTNEIIVNALIYKLFFIAIEPRTISRSLPSTSADSGDIRTYVLVVKLR